MKCPAHTPALCKNAVCPMSFSTSTREIQIDALMASHHVAPIPGSCTELRNFDMQNAKADHMPVQTVFRVVVQMSCEPPKARTVKYDRQFYKMHFGSRPQGLV